MEEWLTVAGDYGFAAAVAFFLLYRMEKKVDRLIAVVEQMNHRTTNVPFPSPSSSITEQRTIK